MKFDHCLSLISGHAIAGKGFSEFIMLCVLFFLKKIVPHDDVPYRTLRPSNKLSTL